MPVQKRHEVDPKIKVKHAIAFFNNKQVRLAECVGVYPSHVSVWAREPEEYLQPLHAYRLREIHPEIMQAAADMQAYEDAERHGHPEHDLRTIVEGS